MGLVCPICSTPLQAGERTFTCGTGHAFDRAREGYVDLLPVGHGRSGKRGDTAEMVRARRRFLGRGHYQALAEQIAAAAREAWRRAGGGRTPTVLDAGCGEGYYLRAVAAGLEGAPAKLLGLDISRDALRLAARAQPEALFFVSDVAHRIPMADGSVAVLLDVFAPRNPVEFARVLEPGGVAVVVIPTAGHLAELRAALPMIGIEEEKRDRTAGSLGEALRLEGEQVLEEETVLSGEDAADLLRMSPSRWHLDEATLLAVAAGGPVAATLGFRILEFRA